MQLHTEIPHQPDLQAVEWRGASLMLLDQRLLPEQTLWVECLQAADVAAAIRDGVMIGAAAAGIAAAYGMVLAARSIGRAADWPVALADDFALLEAARPSSAVLCWALRMLRERLHRPLAIDADVPTLLEEAARSIQLSDLEASRVMSRLGVQLIRKQDRQPQQLLAHGYTGMLSGSGQGGALAVIAAAHAAGLVAQVHLGAGYPGRSGLLSDWELGAADIPALLHADTAVGRLMQEENPSWLIVGAERIAANGDLIAERGTYALAVLAMHHGLRLMVVAPSAAIDLQLEHADDLEFEDAQAGPWLDVTPADLIDVIVTEKGAIPRPGTEGLTNLLSPRRLH